MFFFCIYPQSIRFINVIYKIISTILPFLFRSPFDWIFHWNNTNPSPSEWYIQSMINIEQSSKNYSRKHSDLLSLVYFQFVWCVCVCVFVSVFLLLLLLLLLEGGLIVGQITREHDSPLNVECRNVRAHARKETNIHRGTNTSNNRRPKFKTIRGYLSRKSIGSNVNCAHNRKSFYIDSSQSNCETVNL